MSLAEQITALTTDKTNIRDSILAKGGTCPSENGFDDFATDIGTIPSGGLEYKATAAEMNATLVSSCEGHIYEYTGTDTSTYKNGRLYLVEYTKPFLCFTAEQPNSTIGMIIVGTLTTVPTFETSQDGLTWVSYTIGDTITLTNVGDKVYWRGNNTHVSESVDNRVSFTMTGLISATGNVMSLLDKNCDLLTISTAYCFTRLFFGCSSLTTSPSLPATIFGGVGVYLGMFQGCSNLQTVPNLPATELIQTCYAYMFSGCISLKVYAQSGDGHDKVWHIPKEGTPTGYTNFPNLFSQTEGDYSMGAVNVALKSPFYTQNTPV